MNDTEQILAELRKISAWADLQRKATRWLLVFLATSIPALVIFGVVMERRIKTTFNDPAPVEKADWYDVDQHVRRGEFDDALKIGEKLIVRTPHYPEAHRRLASAYLAAGEIPKATEHFAEAFRLFPSEEYEKLLRAIEKRTNAVSPPLRSEKIPTPSTRGINR